MAEIDDGNICQRNQSTSHRLFLHKITWICTLGGLLFGYDTGVINGALPFMRKDLGLTALTVGVTASSLLIGAAFGAFIGGKMSDKFGRRPTLIGLSIIFIIGTIGSSLAPGFALMVPFRVILGLAVGGASSTVPVFLAELSPAETRGQVVSFNELMIVTGQLIAFITNAVLGTIWGHNDSIWRWMLLLAVIPAIGLLFGLLFAGVPESPRWLASHGFDKEALNVLKQIRKSEAVAVEELADVNKMAQEEDQQMSFWDMIGERWLRRCVLIGIWIAMCNQLAGVNSIMYYGTEILSDSGLGTQSALIANIANGAVSVFAAGLGIWLLGRVGRRKMLLTGQIGTICAHLLIGICSLTMPQGQAKGFVILSLTVTFLFFQQGGISPTTWLMQSEIFPLRVRGFAMGLSTFILWMVNFFIGLLFPILVDAVTISTTFFIFFFIGIFAAAMVWRWVPETMGKTLEELERQFHEEDMAVLKKAGPRRKIGLHLGEAADPKQQKT
ncbi:sugar transporter domain-containing protein [Ditylenchus destructor]|uniref:Sugar transporter domain-containing protein n=1 Tax=Ditylenchus destructor TaxID=166010 RepID=A0AAD4RBF8_9BILA|nr:sugar transporter domain-containing protein [Ditylenchus destructor]